MADKEESEEKGSKIAEKSLKKIWKFHFFAVTLHPLSRQKMLLATAQSRVLKGEIEFPKNFLKKVSKKFGRFKNLPYLCTTFALIKQPRCKK